MSISLPLEIALGIGGLGITLQSSDPLMTRWLATRYMPWRTATISPFQVHIRPWGPLRGEWCTTPVHSFRDGRCYITAVGCQGVVDVEAGIAYLELAPERSLADVEYFLRVVLALLAFHRDGLLLHAAGIVHEEQGYLFVGPSGAGKSTVVRASAALPGTHILNDDLVLVMPQDGGWRIRGTPFWNPDQPLWMRSGQTMDAPLTGIYRLVQAEQNEAYPLRPAIMTAALLSAIPVLPSSAAYMPGLLQRLSTLTLHVPGYDLRFTPTASFWQAITVQ
ncbi:MAG TPA: hypothetical protein EYP04_12570 [Anaerolineae bacterium]|nr:hypothetical protein [Anaerolineae bacterium]HIQ05180.1 hypothetical protein [Anaerolineae bacterium]